ncbi:MAG: PAS domain S-box protein [Acidobacteriia bacterium]|nr:PAS domain S-box protein [Terriglobia bacterium]
MAANPATQLILGYPPAVLQDLPVVDLIHPEDRPSFDRALEAALNGSRDELETRFRKADGSYRWLLWHAMAVEGRIFAIAHDITDTKSRLDERFHRLFETAKDSIIVIDAFTGLILECNRHTQESLGYGKDELRGQPISTVPAFQFRNVGERLFRALQASKTWRSEEEICRKDGQKIAMELLCNRYREGGSELMQANIRDISERKRTEAELRESEERFRVLMEGVRDYAIFMTDPQGKVVSWGRGAERILGYKEAEILGTDSALVFTPEDRERGEPELEIQTALRDGRAEDERWHLRKDGSRFFASGVLTPLWRSENELRGFAKVMRDITERKTHEEAMREAQKLESIGLLAGGVAHDFNNLLTGIIGSASLAAEDLAPSLRARGLLEQVIKAGKRAADLTRQLLAYAGKGSITLESFNISDAVSEILHLLHASIPERVRLHLHLENDLPPIEADPSQIQQIAMNLVLNAAEAIEDDGIISITTGSKQFHEDDLRRLETLSSLRPGEYVFLRVKDSGMGMNEEVKARIFDPFFTTKFTGRGLGLAAVSGIVRGYRGAIEVATAPEQGSAFEVYLPISPKAAAAQRESEPAANERGSGTVLVVDDEAVVRDVSKEALERGGYRVLLAENGREALDIFRQHSGIIDLVLLDLAMPVMSGEETHRLMKEIRTDVPILVSSGYSEAMASSRFGRRGMEAFIQKPYTAREVVERVQKTLSSRRN